MGGESKFDVDGKVFPFSTRAEQLKSFAEIWKVCRFGRRLERPRERDGVKFCCKRYDRKFPSQEAHGLIKSRV
jgi:hypothetical protein